mmetsp:Transcript_16316/g.37648  ORF Transcript_16316/g.37648 Transcript_16316/m.37648 type:complete len:566 (-) Transcript_16316:24-1721(-)
MAEQSVAMRLLPLACLVYLAVAANDGLARTPPMGWRSWNCFGVDVSQQMMQSIMDSVADRTRLVDGVHKSLADLGYVYVGLDDGWQAPKSGVNGSFHAADGHPLIDSKKFPSMKGMTSYGHQKGLKVDWYMNNCWEVESMFKNQTPAYAAKHMRGDVNAIVSNEFDGVKLDGCGPYTNLSWWYELLNTSGRPSMVENCHWGDDPPPCAGGVCPFHFWRVSMDITNTWDSMMGNLQEVKPFLLDPPIAGPGQWAYPDMMETGRLADYFEDRANFGLWAITSSPLILGFDLRNKALLDSLWPVIANPEAIAVSQAWEGHPGHFVKESRRGLYTRFVVALPCHSSGEWVEASSWSLRFNSTNKSLAQIYDDKSGKCADAQPDAGHIHLNPCNWTASQIFTYDAKTGHLQAPLYKNNKGQLNGCLDIGKKVGPRLQLTTCSSDPNLSFRFKDGTWYGGGTDARPEFPLRCLSVEQQTEIVHQIWSKPMPNKSLAVLFVNSKAESQSFNASLVADLKLPQTTAYKVRDIWERRDVATVAAAGTLATDVLKKHDTRFYLLTPVSTAAAVMI